MDEYLANVGIIGRRLAESFGHDVGRIAEDKIDKEKVPQLLEDWSVTFECFNEVAREYIGSKIDFLTGYEVLVNNPDKK